VPALDLSQIAQHSVVRARLEVGEAVAFIETAGPGIDLIDVDVHLGSAAFTHLMDRGCQQRRVCGGHGPILRASLCIRKPGSRAALRLGPVKGISRVSATKPQSFHRLPG
jgi:hypothetical protein